MITSRLYGRLRFLLFLAIFDLIALIVIADLVTGVYGMHGDGLFMVLFLLLVFAGLWLLPSGLHYLHRVVPGIRPRQQGRKYRSSKRLSS
jgi:uncharacterized membrane protein YcaP (DUF421 family)